jgi:hypothetical protein
MSAFTAALGRHKLVVFLGAIVILPILVFTMWVTTALHYSYSEGERSGLLQKFSHRGWLCKTWEGELLMSAVPGTTPEKFVFTTRSDSLAAVLKTFDGQHVALDYQQHKGLPSRCFGDTEYFVTGVRQVATPP